MRTVISFPKPDDAHLARALLEGSGIRAFIRDEHTVTQQWFYSNAIGGVRVEVADEDFERAKEIIRLPPCDDGILTCPKCGSRKIRTRELSVWAALAFAMGTAIPVKSRMADCLECKQSSPISKCIRPEPNQPPQTTPVSAPR